MPTTTRPWAPDNVEPRDLRAVHRRWPTTTVYVIGAAILIVLLCVTETVR